MRYAQLFRLPLIAACIIAGLRLAAQSRFNILTYRQYTSNLSCTKDCQQKINVASTVISFNHDFSAMLYFITNSIFPGTEITTV